MNLSTDIKYLQGVGPMRAELLQKELGITTVGELLEYYPYRYVDRTRTYRIREIDGNMPYVQLCGQIVSMEEQGEGRSKRIIAHVGDGSGFIDLVWFQGLKFVQNAYKVGHSFLIFGKPTIFNGRYQINHPEMEDAPEGWKPQNIPVTGNLFGGSREEGLWFREESLGLAPRPSTLAPRPSTLDQYTFRPHYHTTERMKKSFMNSSAIAKLTATMLRNFAQPFDETLPPFITEQYKLMSRDEALRNIHFPTSAEALRRAQARLKFEELFFVQLGILRYARNQKQKSSGAVFSVVGDAFNTFYHKHLPFQLTGAQKRVIKEVREDVRSGKQMNRLVQGDVGSGKTLVALMCALIAIDNGYQVVLMAPTEILAEQHLETLRNFVGDMPLRIELLTGSVKGKRRTKILEELAAGDINILVGTHAVIEDAVVFHKLGLAIIDEQHRFGVAQRAKLWEKTDAAPPHVLVMTATPIPRTLAMTLYGDLDVSIIDELPPGRKPIQTIHQFDAHRERIYAMMRRELKLGRQIYVVYPLIKENEKYVPVEDADYAFEARDGSNVLTAKQRKSQESLDLKNLEDGYDQLCRAFPDYRVSKVHGKLKPAEKDIEMEAFASGRTQILVATTVIEVGVNVPNASIMIIENAERFGLSQLHQLRGRVGRGADQSYCILVTTYKLSENTRKRIQIMVDSTDGFEIAEADLKLRGPGDLDGTAQSGMAFDFKIANLARDGQILTVARSIAQQVVEADPDESLPQYTILWKRLRELKGTNINWGLIS